MNSLAVVSGGTKGIGKATVEIFLKNGFDVITCSRNQNDLERLKNNVGSGPGAGEVFVHPCDLSTSAGVGSFLDYIRSLDRSVQVLVNNTGVFIPGEVHTEAPGILEKSIETNLYSAYHLTRGLLPPMIAQKQGHIFTICSIASIKAYPNGGSYSISKFALYGMTKVLREELKPHRIRVTAVLPGATLTDSWAGTDLPPERFMKSEDIAQAIWTAWQLSPGTVMEDLILRPQLGDL